MIYATSFSIVSYKPNNKPGHTGFEVDEVEHPMPPDDTEDWELVTSVLSERNGDTAYIFHNWRAK